MNRLHFYFDPDCKHVEIWTQVRHDVHINLDWYAQGVNQMVVNTDEFERIFLNQPGTVLRLDRRSDRWRYPLIATCVGVAKHLAGIRSFALTPRQLKRDLIRAGACEVHFYGGEEAEEDSGAERARADAAAGAA